MDSARNSSEAPPRPPSQAPTFSRTSAPRRARWRPPPPPPSRRPRRRLAPPTAASRCTTCCSPRSRASTSASHAHAPPPPPSPSAATAAAARAAAAAEAARARWLAREPGGRASTSRRSPRFGWRGRLRPTPTSSCAFARPRGARAHAQGNLGGGARHPPVVVRLTNEHAKHRVEIAWRREQRPPPPPPTRRRRRADDGGGGGDARDGGARRQARDAGDRGGGARGGAARRDRRAGRAAAPFVPLFRTAGAVGHVSDAAPHSRHAP